MPEFLQNLTPTTIVVAAVALVALINIDFSSILDKLKVKQIPLSNHAMLQQQIRLLREATCHFDSESRNAIAEDLDDIQKAVEATYMEAPKLEE